jgi:NAD(P)-dependent dehydrogenase (short-subunit alcohol dehydrogenase family)
MMVKVLVRQVDVSDLDSVAAFAKAVQSEFAKLDVLVNNAGINGIGNGGPARTRQGIEQVSV